MHSSAAILISGVFPASPFQGPSQGLAQCMATSNISQAELRHGDKASATLGSSGLIWLACVMVRAREEGVAVSTRSSSLCDLEENHQPTTVLEKEGYVFSQR